MRTPLLCVLAALAAVLPAQTHVWSPRGSATQEGNSNNTIPFWSLSATYQQIHDYENMGPVLGHSATPLLGLMLRKDNSGTPTTGRTLDLQLTLGATPVSARSPSTTFATNLGSSPTVVLPYGLVNLPPLTQISVPNPAGFIIPFTTPFVYVPAPGFNLCWEWRHMNASSNLNSSMDADSTGSYSAGLEGTGCLTSGQTLPSSITTRSLGLSAQTYRSVLDRAAANAPGVFALGSQRVNISFPGQCAPLLLNPLVFLSGATDAAGMWDMTLTTPDFRNGPQVEILGQYVWLDGLQPTGLGFSDMSFVRTAMGGTGYMCRLYACPYQGGAGFELATTATGSSVGYGLVTGFITP